MSARTPAGKLVTAFGDPAEMSMYYSPDVQWSLSASLAQFPRATQSDHPMGDGAA